MNWNVGRTHKMELTASAFAVLPCVLHLAPAKLSGTEVCPNRSSGCTAACLNQSGRGQMNVVQRQRVAKTLRFLADPQGFADCLTKEARMLERRAVKRGLTLTLRPNGTSDIPWENLLPADVLAHCYDYTKSVDRWRSQGYYQTLSWHEEMRRSPVDLVREALAAGRPGIAVVCSPELHAHLVTLPDYLGIPVVDGTLHDYRPSDPPGSMVVLSPLGRAKRDTLGFVVRDEAQLQMPGPRANKRRLMAAA